MPPPPSTLLLRDTSAQGAAHTRLTPDMRTALTRPRPPGQSHLIWGIGSTSHVITSLFLKLCCIDTLYRPLKNLDAIALPRPPLPAATCSLLTRSRHCMSRQDTSNTSRTTTHQQHHTHHHAPPLREDNWAASRLSVCSNTCRTIAGPR